MKNIKLKFLRALSLLLASLFIINPFGTPIYAATSEVTEQPQKIIENNTDGDNIITNSDVGPLSSHTPALFNNSEIEKLTEYAIGGVFALASFAAISLAVLLPSSHDIWFTRLGGTQKEIDAYNNAKGQTTSQDAATYNEFLVECKNRDQKSKHKFIDLFHKIAIDIPRTSFGGKSFQLNTSTFHNGVDGACIDQFRRILFIYYMYLAPENKKHDFVQGETDILAMIYSKFLGHNKILTDDDEAKVCYVFSQLMLVKNKFDIALKNGNSGRFLESYIDTFSSNLTSKEDRMQWFSLISAVVKAYCNLSDLLVAPVQTLGLRLFKDEGAMKMWDHIIMDNSMFSEGHLNYDKFFSTIVNLTLSLLLERSKNIDLNDLAALASLLNFNS